MILPKRIVTSVSIDFCDFHSKAGLFIHFKESCEHFYIFDHDEAIKYFLAVKNLIGKHLTEELSKTPSEFEKEESNG